MSKKKNKIEYHGDYPIEIKYFEAAIEASASKVQPEEAEKIRKLGIYLINVAYKTKEKFEENNTSN